ncbi:MAG: protein kinase, partial [Proteobacteria bacterium]|nr:protein kinase [Pseudomonadota bacterium]
MENRIFTDTTEFFDIDHRDVIRLADNKSYRITGNTKEMRFGVEDPKYWVKRAIDTETNERKIIKLMYFETFETVLGGLKINCFRDPDKESAVLELVANHPAFMHGTSHKDSKGNNVRVLDMVRGQNFYLYIESLNHLKHEEYFHSTLPNVLKKLVKAFEAILFLHTNGFRHGDIRNDHLILESDTGNYVWIDFDYDF